MEINILRKKSSAFCLDIRNSSKFMRSASEQDINTYIRTLQKIKYLVHQHFSETTNKNFSTYNDTGDGMVGVFGMMTIMFHVWLWQS